MDNLLTPQEVAEILRTTSRRVCYELDIPYIKVGGKRRYEPKDVENYKKKNKHYPIDIITYQRSNKKREYVV